MPNRDLPGLATFFFKPQKVLVSVVLKVPAGELGHGANAGSSVDEDADNRPIPETDHMSQVD